MAQIIDILVDFDEFCPTCKHNKLTDTDYPCDECLEHPTNQESHKPVKYEEAK